MKFIDAHAHMDDPKFEADLQQVLARAKDAGCLAIITHAIELEQFPKLLGLKKQYPIIKLAFGVYPSERSEAEIKQILQTIKSHKKEIIAIGEIGLDYNKDTTESNKQKQKQLFIAQLDLATQLKIPAIIHSRGAEIDCANIILERNQKRTVFHCYAGPIDKAIELAKLGCFFSIPVRAYSSRHFKDLILALPISNILTETDAPYLHYKQERNVPANIPITIELIAKIKQIEINECAQMLISNYLRLFEKI